MTKSIIRIASELVGYCPGTFKMTSGERQLLIGMIAEELEKQTIAEYKRGYRVGYQDRKLDTMADPLSQALNEGNGVYKP